MQVFHLRTMERAIQHCGGASVASVSSTDSSMVRCMLLEHQSVDWVTSPLKEITCVVALPVWRVKTMPKVCSWWRYRRGQGASVGNSCSSSPSKVIIFFYSFDVLQMFWQILLSIFPFFFLESKVQRRENKKNWQRFQNSRLDPLTRRCW